MIFPQTDLSDYSFKTRFSLNILNPLNLAFLSHLTVYPGNHSIAVQGHFPYSLCFLMFRVLQSTMRVSPYHYTLEFIIWGLLHLFCVFYQLNQSFPYENLLSKKESQWTRVVQFNSVEILGLFLFWMEYPCVTLRSRFWTVLYILASA